MDSVNFQIAFGAVKHFGRNLYTSNPPAIAELVANAWDAYATECQINFKNGALLIFDNGIGMNNNEFEKRYAISGSEKNLEIRRPDGMDARPYMGRKGIGKFSAFSLGEKYILYTKSTEDTYWKKIKLEYSSLMLEEAIIPIPIEHLDNLSELEEYSPKLLDLKHGTIILIPDIKRKITKATETFLSDLLSRRFSVNISEKYNFKLFFNNREINLKEHFYYKEIEFLYYFGYTSEEIKNRFPKFNDKNFKDFSNNTFFKEHKIKGWIGSVTKTENLKIENELNSVGVIVYINGKLADENILSSVQNSTISNLYIVGEIEADFLQDEVEDPVLSSREGLNKENENVILLRQELDNIRNDLAYNWNTLRASRPEKQQDYLNEILKNEQYNNMYKNLKENEKNRLKKYFQVLFDGKKNPISDKLTKHYVPFLISIINTEVLAETTIKDEDEISEIIDKFYTLFDKTEINTAIRIKANIQERLEIIDRLRKNIADEAVEKVFEKHLAKNPWLINPYWDVESRVEITTQERYESMIEKGKVEGISDIIIRVHEEKFPIIVEVKREKKTSYSSPSCEQIIQQIKKYRDGIINILTTTYPNKDYDVDDRTVIKAFIILGIEALNKIEKRDLTDLKKNNIKIMTYDEIINTANNLYNYDLKEFE